jgi:hypothetical protein
MSIKVGYLNENYTLDNLQTQNNTLTLNSFIDSNVILINPEKGTCQDMFINYQNEFFTGLSSNTYIFRTNIENLLTMNNSNITLFKPTYILDNVHIKDVLHTSNTGVYVNSNFVVNFVTPTDIFKVSDVLTITSNYIMNYNISNLSINSGNKSIIGVNASSINMSNNVYLYNGTLYLNKISGLNGVLNFENVTYNTTIIDNFKATESFIVANKLSDTIDITPFAIYKKTGNANILSINTCNINNTITNHLTMNNNGQLGIGTKSPNASLTITNISNSNIINYMGSSNGDVFKLTYRGNVGIGTSEPKGQLHIYRNDDLLNNEFRKTPMMYMDMNYNAAKNISNLYTNYNSSLSDISMAIYPYTVISSNISSGLNVNINNTFYLLNQSIYTSMDNKIQNISNIILPNPATVSLPINIGQQPVSIAANSITLTNNIIYPASDNIYIALEMNNSTPSPEYEAYYSLIMMTKNTFNNGGYNNVQGNVKYNADKFTNFNNPLNGGYINKLNKGIVYQILGYNITCTIDFIIEKNLLENGSLIPYYPFNYTKITPIQLNAPNFWTITSNNTFVSSLSASGILSLGTLAPDNEYMLYTRGKGLFGTLNTCNITTSLANGNIGFNNKNLVNVNTIECQTLQSANLTLNDINITNLQANKISAQEGNYSNIATSNLEFYTLNNNYLNFSYKNAHFGTRCSIGNDKELENMNSMKITVDNQIVPTNTTFESTSFYTRHNGISVYNNTVGINPCINIKTINTDTIPYFHINNSVSGYYFRIKKNQYSGTTTTNFQIISDNFIDTTRKNYYYTTNYEPHLFQHIKEYNIITLGEQNTISIDSLNKSSRGINNTNSSSKVAIGVPYAAMVGSYDEKDYPKYFNNVINNDINPYMLNIFGNVKIANINNNPIFTCITQTNNIYTAINGHPDNINTLRIFGDTATSNMTVYKDLTVAQQFTSSNLITSNITMLNDDADIIINVPGKGAVSLVQFFLNNIGLLP